MLDVAYDAAVARAALLACELEAEAEKPGNVTPRRRFPNMEHADFVASARAIAPVMAGAAGRRVGETVLRAIEATRRAAVVRGAAPANTNVGIVLLLAPLAKAAAEASIFAERPDAGARREALRKQVRRVLAGLDVEDARLAYAAIRLARPAGMGRSAEADLESEPTVSLLEAMRLAAPRDSVASEYATGYAITFGRVEPALAAALASGLPPGDAVVETYLDVLAEIPDTHIRRKLGDEAAAEASRRAAQAIEAGPAGSPGREHAVAAFDEWLRDPARRRNPGTTADLLAAALFVHVASAGEASLATARRADALP